MGVLRPQIRLFALAGIILAGSAFVCAQTPLPDQPLANLGGAAKLLNFTGQISVLRDSTALWALNSGDVVQPEQVIVTGTDGWGVFQVADGSKFEVFPNSRVIFRANRGDWKDLLEVWLGQVRVQIDAAYRVSQTTTKKSVRPTAVISGPWHHFRCQRRGSGWLTVVTDEEGVVEVRHALRLYDPPKVLNPNEWVRVYRNEPLAKATIDKGNTFFQRAFASRFRCVLSGSSERLTRRRRRAWRGDIGPLACRQEQWQSRHARHHHLLHHRRPRHLLAISCPGFAFGPGLAVKHPSVRGLNPGRFSK